MGYSEQMRHHLDEMLEFDRKIVKYQNQAREQLRSDAVKARDPNLNTTSWHLVLQARLRHHLQEDPWFKDLVEERSFHTSRAALYAQMVLVENMTLQVDPRG